MKSAPATDVPGIRASSRTGAELVTCQVHDSDTRPRTDHIDEPVGVVAEAQGGEEQAHGSAREDEHGDRAGPHDLRRAGSEEDASDLAAR